MSHNSTIQDVFSPGIKLMLIATIGFTIMQVIIKELGSFHVFQIVCFRAGVTALLSTYYLLRLKVSLVGNKQGWLIARAICGLISMTLFFVTVQRMPLGASVSLKYLSPIFTAIFAFLFLKEKVKPFQWVMFALAFGGVYMLKGFDSRIDMISFILGIIGALFAGCVYVIIRKIGDSEHPLIIVNYFMLLAFVISGIAMIPYWITPTTTELALLVTIGGFGYLGQKYMTQSFQAEDASRVVPIKYMELVYSLIIGFIWFGEGYSFLALLGIMLILVAMVGNVILSKQ